MSMNVSLNVTPVEFLFDTSESQFYPKIYIRLWEQIFIGYDFYSERFFVKGDQSTSKESTKELLTPKQTLELQKIFEESFEKQFYMTLEEYTDYLRKKEDLLDLNTEQMEGLLFYIPR